MFSVVIEREMSALEENRRLWLFIYTISRILIMVAVIMKTITIITTIIMYYY